MTLSRVLRGALVGAVAASVVLSGCTADEPAPTPTSAAPTDEPTAAPTTEPAEIAPPEKPTVMDTNDAIGARAAAEYFLSLYGYVFQTGDLTEWDAMCDAESEFCKSVRERVQADEQGGYTREGGDATTTVARVVEPSAGVEFFEVAGSVVQAPSVTVDVQGTVVDSREAIGDVDFSILLKMNPEGQWVVRAVAFGDPQ